jgi:hypothetical protein
MNVIYRYHHHFYITELLLGLAISGILLITWVPPVLFLLLYHDSFDPALKAALLLTSTSVMIIILLLIIRREIRSSHIELTDNVIVQKSPYKIITVGYQAVKSIVFVHVPLFRGYIRIGADRGTLRIPLYINTCAKMVENLLQMLDKSEQTCCDQRTAAIIKREAAAADSAYLRSRHAVMPLGCSMLLTAFVSLFISTFFWDLAVQSVIVWSFMGFLFPVFAFFLAEHRYDLAVRINDQSRGRNDPPEEPDYLLYGFITFIIYCISGILFRNCFA